MAEIDGIEQVKQDLEERDLAERVNAGDQMDAAALQMKASLEPLSAAIASAPPELIQDLCDANLNAHHALGRLNSARAMLRRPDVDA